MSAAVSSSSRDTSPYALAEALRRETPPERTHRTVHPCDSAWAASFFLCRLLGAAPAPPRIDRARAQSILTEHGCPDFLPNAEQRAWIRFVLDVAMIPGAVRSALRTGHLHGDLATLSTQETQALLALSDATHQRHEFRLTRAKATELRDLHALAHAETPSMDALVELKVFVPASEESVTLPIFDNEIKGPWLDLRPVVLARFWEDIIRNALFASDEARLIAWLDVASRAYFPSDAVDQMEGKARNKLVRVALERILVEPDLKGRKRELDRIQWESDWGDRGPWPAPRPPGGEASILARYRWWVQIDNGMIRHDCRHALTNLIYVVVRYDDPWRNNAIRLLDASERMPYLAREVPSYAQSIPELTAAFVAHPTTASLGMDLLDGFALNRQREVHVESAERNASESAIHAYLWAQGLQLFAATMARAPAKARAHAWAQVLLAAASKTVGERRDSVPHRVDGKLSAMRRLRTLTEWLEIDVDLLREIGNDLCTFFERRAREQSVRDVHGLPKAEFKLLLWLLRAMRTVAGAAENPARAIAESILRVYRRILERRLSKGDLVWWYEDDSGVEAMPWVDLFIVLYEHEFSSAFLRAMADSDVLSVAVAASALCERCAERNLADVEHRLGQTQVRKMRLHLRLLLVMHSQLRTRSYDPFLDLCTSDKRSALQEIESEVLGIFDLWIAGNSGDGRVALFEPDVECHIHVTPGPPLVEFVVQRLLGFDVEVRDKVFHLWIAREPSPLVLGWMLKYGALQTTKELVTRRLREIDLDVFLDRERSILTIQRLAEVLAVTGPFDLAEKVLEWGDLKRKQQRTEAEWAIFSFKAKLLVSYQKKDDILAIEQLAKPDGSILAVDWPPRDTLEDTRTFYKALTLLRTDAKRARDLFDRLLRAQPTIASYAVNRFGADVQIAEEMDRGDARARAFLRALYEWNSAMKDIDPASFGYVADSVAYNRLSCFDGAEKSDFDNLFEREWSELSQQTRSNIEILKLALQHFRRRKLEGRVQQVLAEARSYYVGKTDASTASFATLELGGAAALSSGVAELPNSALHVVTELRLVDECDAAMGASGGQLSVLAVASEWASKHGGLSTFNRALCSAWVRARPGDRVFCLVPQASDQEKEDAERARVILVVAPGKHGLPDEARLVLPLRPGISPNVIIGHGRVTGPAASALADQFRGSRRIHFSHVVPEEIEWFKDHRADEDPARKAEDRTRHELERAATAQLAVAVGSHLTRELGNGLHPRHVKVHPFYPGLMGLLSTVAIPPAIQVLVLGRVDDYELKGLDIAARAVAELGQGNFTSRPRLVVRGTPAGTGKALYKKLKKSASRYLDPFVREYTADATLIYEDLMSSSVVLMPSRSEGFGLVGLEAISLGVPVLVSKKSGLAELLKEHAPDLARFCVVDVVDNKSEDTVAWRDALEVVLLDRVAAFERAKKLREVLDGKLSWEKEVISMVETLYATPAAVDRLSTWTTSQ